MPNPILKNWLDLTWTPSVTTGNTLGQQYRYKNSWYEVFVAAEALTAGIPCYRFASVGGAIIEGDVLMASGGAGGKFDEIDATSEELACGTAGASESGGTLANYTLNFRRIDAT